jgi:hypothetical protein
MDDGRVAEYDQPHALLQDPQSHLSALAMSAGKEADAHLRELAAEAAGGVGGGTARGL